MILDKMLELSNGQALSSASALSTYSVNLSALLRDVGSGTPLFAVIVIDTSAAAADAADTVTFQLVADSTENLATSATVILGTTAYTGSVLTAGRDPIVIPIPPFTPPGATDQYIGIYYVLSAAFTSFTVSAYIARDVQTNV